MGKFTVLMGPPCSGKTTKFNQVFDWLSKDCNSVPVFHTFFNKKKDCDITKQIGFEFLDLNLIFIGSHNKRGQLQGLDVITNSSGMNMDTFDDFLKEMSNKNILTEANYSFSPARKLPSNIHSLGFDSCNWILLKHPNREVMVERKMSRAEESGRVPSEKSLDNAWAENVYATRLLGRFREESDDRDTIRCYKSTTSYELTVEELT